jgi:hypothetical protein
MGFDMPRKPIQKDFRTKAMPYLDELDQVGLFLSELCFAIFEMADVHAVFAIHGFFGFGDCFLDFIESHLGDLFVLFFFFFGHRLSPLGSRYFLPFFL